MIKSNLYGKLLQTSDDTFQYHSANQQKKILIRTNSELETTFIFDDGSFFKISPKTSQVTRYSRLTGQTEVLAFDNSSLQQWTLASSIQSIHANFLEFSSAHQTQPKPQPLCDDPFESEHCDRIQPAPSHEIFDSPELTLFDSKPLYGASQCGYEKDQYEMEGYNGFATLERCSRVASIGTAVAAIGVAGSIGGLGAPLVGTLPAYALAAANLADTRFQCQRASRAAYRTYTQCLEKHESNSDNEGSGTVGPGSAISSSICTKVTQYKVCNKSGDCNYWTESSYTPCMTN
ncbi:hypothetical protein [Psychrobium sp. 1_MG-2023]|uniref:hypothetical protein n=1 Tax=Psychrobium sp. 1_MG-2023 TaxID=3062624 RepID=UPI001291B9C6|nr:hypothetical protein [Psychrobium sp. 1_MG-2023]MDP2562960.1 hypothetical protein [Psychrobium sp. 1_MG-2023]